MRASTPALHASATPHTTARQDVAVQFDPLRILPRAPLPSHARTRLSNLNAVYARAGTRDHCYWPNFALALARNVSSRSKRRRRNVDVVLSAFVAASGAVAALASLILVAIKIAEQRAARLRACRSATSQALPLPAPRTQIFNRRSPELRTFQWTAVALSPGHLTCIRLEIATTDAKLDFDRVATQAAEIALRPHHTDGGTVIDAACIESIAQLPNVAT